MVYLHKLEKDSPPTMNEKKAIPSQAAGVLQHSEVSWKVLEVKWNVFLSLGVQSPAWPDWARYTPYDCMWQSWSQPTLTVYNLTLCFWIRKCRFTDYWNKELSLARPDHWVLLGLSNDHSSNYQNYLLSVNCMLGTVPQNLQMRKWVSLYNWVLVLSTWKLLSFCPNLPCVCVCV